MPMKTMLVMLPRAPPRPGGAPASVVTSSACAVIAVGQPHLSDDLGDAQVAIEPLLRGTSRMNNPWRNLN